MKFILTPALLLFVCICFAQQPIKNPHYNFFVKNDGSIVENVDSADYIRFVFEPNDGSSIYDVDEYYKKGQLRFTGKTSNINPLQLVGQATWFYENGNRKMVAAYLSNFWHGELTQFFPNGKPYITKKFVFKDGKETRTPDYRKLSDQDSLIISAYDTSGKAVVENGNGYLLRYNSAFDQIIEQDTIKNGKLDGTVKGKDLSRKISFTEQYQNGVLVSGTSIDSAGVSTNYTKRFIRPEYPGGVMEMGKFLGRNIRYPQQARLLKQHGTVLLKIVIQHNGKLKDVKVINSVVPSIDQEAIRVVQQMPDWIPGTAYGKPASFVYTLPITFKVEMYY
ncbi:energy transducer TonB [Mucilaginibacter sp. KACC 22063]|uniref:energy transducer TonB n=1 Tax=Mucilaginibacter sp. KACC 22063 TaxID=3025666 RepID=UPI002365A391|nr:energy transducer TonB [Mucilaginibacter sp. KACC 22063]WDF55557.1 TonB family protein [Mucilaginibacter sp. KACC 22063]